MDTLNDLSEDKTPLDLGMVLGRYPILEKKEAKGIMTITHSDNTVEEKELDVIDFTGKVTNEQLCVVGTAMGATINLGNYQSAKVQVSLFVPCEIQHINDVYALAETWVEARLELAGTKLAASAE